MRRVAILFAGGPAPGANAVINAASMAARREGVEVVAILDGYAALQSYDPVARPLVEGKDWRLIVDADLRGLRNARGVLVGTSRAHPGRGVRSAADLADPARTDGLRRVWQGLVDLDVDGLISIGGDGTLRTANLLVRWQAQLPVDARRVAIVHVPKTIDNDYAGIDFTFGFFTAVDTLAKEILNLRADALATSSYFVVECMGRRAGWLAYGAAIAGEAHLVVGVEDIDAGIGREVAWTDPETGEAATRWELDLDALVERIVGLILRREEKGKRYGVVVLAEGLVERLPAEVTAALPRDASGVYGLGTVQIGRMVAARVATRFKEVTGRDRKVTGVALGYESRCAAPHAFDVVLGCQLGVAAARALIDDGAHGVMVSVSGQMDVRHVAFDTLIDAETLTTEVRYVRPGSDLHRLAHLLGTRLRPPS